MKKLIDEISRLGQIKFYAKGEFLFNADDRADGFFFVQSGEVRIFRINEQGKEVEVVRLSPGDFFGEAIVFLSERFPAFAQAVRKSQVLYFYKKDILRKIDDEPAVARSFITLLAQKCVVLHRRIETLELRTVRQRLAQFLLSHSTGDRAYTVELKMKKAELAGLLGTIPETISRNLKKLEEENLIRMRGRQISVIDSIRLKQELSN